MPTDHDVTPCYNRVNSNDFKRWRYREETADCQRGGALGDWVKKAKGLRSTDW